MCKLCKGTGYVGGVKCICSDTVLPDNQYCAKCKRPLFFSEWHRRVDGQIVCCTPPTWKELRSEEAVCEWPDGSWCWFDELHEMEWKGDDFSVVFFDPEKHK